MKRNRIGVFAMAAIYAALLVIVFVFCHWRMAAVAVPIDVPAPGEVSCCKPDEPCCSTNPAGAIYGAYVEVRARDGIGSGTLISRNGRVLVLTAAHVAERHKTVKVVKCTGDTESIVTADVLISRDYRCGEADVAVLLPRSPVPGGAAVSIDFGVHPRRGEDAWYCGTPRGAHGSIERTIINHPRWEADGHQYFSVNGNGWYGNSGCGAYVVRDGKPKLVGVLVRLIWVEPKSPLLCEGLEAIEAVLAESDALPKKGVKRARP